MTRLSFTVPGVAEPKGSSRALPCGYLLQLFRRGGAVTIRSAGDLLKNVIVTSDNPDVKRWQHDVQKAASLAVQDLPAADRRLFVEAVSLQVEFYLPRPSGLAKRYKGPHLKKPDLDKLIRATKDALTGVVWVDDSQVTAVIAGKAYAAVGEAPRAVVTVAGIEPPLFTETPAPERITHGSHV